MWSQDVQNEQLCWFAKLRSRRLVPFPQADSLEQRVAHRTEQSDGTGGEDAECPEGIGRGVEEVAPKHPDTVAHHGAPQPGIRTALGMEGGYGRGQVFEIAPRLSHTPKILCR